MTMPHLGNCPHKPGTWCLTCVREEWERREAEADAMRAKLSAAEARIGRLRDLAADAAYGMVYIEGAHGRLYGVGWDRVRDKRVLCESHNDLDPPQAEGASDERA